MQSKFDIEEHAKKCLRNAQVGGNHKC